MERGKPVVSKIEDFKGVTTATTWPDGTQRVVTVTRGPDGERRVCVALCDLVNGLREVLNVTLPARSLQNGGGD